MIRRNLREIIVFTTLLSIIGVGNILNAIGVIDPSREFLIGKLIVFFISYIYFLYIIIRSYLIEKDIKQKFDDKYNAINNSNIVVVFDRNSKVIEANKRFLDMMKYDKEEVIGMSHSSFIYNKMEAKSNDELWNKILLGNSVEGEFQKKDKFGNPIWVSASYSPVRCKNGVVYQVIKIAQDITEDFNNRSEIMQTNIYLEHAGKILRHDMHSGINTYIPRAVKSLDRRLDQKTIRRLKLEPTLKLLKDGLRHTQKVYCGVKEFTNLVKKDVSIELDNHNLKSILSEYLSLTAYKDQVIIDDLVYANVNEPLFCTAIDNFIRNGLRYNDSSTKFVKVYMINELTLGVLDNGRGMTRGDFKKFCLPYQRGFDKESGSGLGLNISVAILSEHGFEIDCEKLEVGTLISVRLKWL